MINGKSFVADNRDEFARGLLAFFSEDTDKENLKEVWIDIIKEDHWFDDNVRTPELYEKWTDENTKQVGMAEDLSNIAKGKIK